MSLLGAPTADLSPLWSKMLIQVIERELILIAICSQGPEYPRNVQKGSEKMCIVSDICLEMSLHKK